MVVSCSIAPCKDCRGQGQYRDARGRFAAWPPTRSNPTLEPLRLQPAAGGGARP
jgi:hypothetical protein